MDRHRGKQAADAAGTLNQGMQGWLLMPTLISHVSPVLLHVWSLPACCCCCYGCGQRTDVAQAVQRSDMYDFLIDIVPREEVKQPAKKVGGGRAG